MNGLRLAHTYTQRLWALEQWPENTQVNLAEELPSLKALIRTAAFILYHSFHPTQLPLASQLFSMFVMHRRC
jgi:hypothetical protein